MHDNNSSSLKEKRFHITMVLNYVLTLYRYYIDGYYRYDIITESFSF